MKTFRFIGMVLITMLMCVNFTSCKDSEDGPSSNSLIGIWEGVEADSWSIVPGSHDEDEEWWASSPDKETDNGVDISNYRIEFNSDMFYRIYLYNENSKMWYLGGVGKWSVSGKKITLVSYDSGDKKYNEENPDEYNILEHKDSKITLEYYKNTPASENYRKMTFKQIASAVEIYENGLARYLDNVDGEWTPNDDGLGDIEWFVIDGVLYWNEEEDGMPDAWILYEIKNIANDEIKLEFKGVLKEDGTYDDYYSDLIGEIEVWTKLE